MGNNVNPILGPDSSTSFLCPVRKKPVLWEEKDVFNPAAVVKDGFVYLLYRAEDKVRLLP
jgi:beta-1,2-mannosidase